MKTKKILTLILATLFLASCKNETKTNIETKIKTEKKENFSVEVEITTDKNDDFPLYYTEDGTVNFNGDHAVWSGVKGQSETQTVILNLSKEIIPTHIRIDFGVKNGDDQGDITLHKFKMSYYGKSFETRGSDFLKYFIKNDSVKTEVDEIKGTITFKRNPKSKLNRFYDPHQAIVDEITKITN